MAKRKRYDTGEGNLDMIKNSVTAIKHHAEELTKELKKNPEIEAWVLAKVDRAAQNLSDVTHYLDGEMNKFASGGFTMAEGGVTKPRLDCVCTKTIKFTNGMNYFEKFTYGCTENHRGDGVSVSYEDGRFTTMSKEIFNKHFEYVNKMAQGGKFGKRYTVNVYYGGEMEDDQFHTDSLSEAKRLSQRGEHSEIYDNYKKELVEIEYAKGERIKVGTFNEEQLIKKEDKKAVEKAREETGLKYVDTKIIKKGGKMYMEVYLIPNEEYYNSSKFAKGGTILNLQDVYNELRSKVGRLSINEETNDYINCDIRDWGDWEHDYEDYDRDEEDFEDDDFMILSRESSMRMSNIVKEVRAKYPDALISWNTSEKNYIDFEIKRK